MPVNGFQPVGLKFASPSPKGLVGFQRQGMDMRKKSGSALPPASWAFAAAPLGTALVLSNNNQTVTGGASAYRIARSADDLPAVGVSTFAVLMPASPDAAIGFCRFGTGANALPGLSNDEGACYYGDGRCFINTSDVGNGLNFSAGGIVTVEIDWGASTMRAKLGAGAFTLPSSFAGALGGSAPNRKMVMPYGLGLSATIVS